MIALAIVLGLVLAVVFAGLMWRWMQVAERVGVARENAGGDERAKAVAELTKRVTALEKYTKGG